MSAVTSAAAFEANISLYIPHVFANFDQAYIANAFKNIGEVNRVDLVGKLDRKGKHYNAVYVHFNHWHNTDFARNFYMKVTNNDEQARLYHDDPWYWIVLPNIAKKHLPGERKETINLEGSQAITSAYHVEPPSQVDTSCYNVIEPEEIDETTAAVFNDEPEFEEFDEEFDEELEAAQMEEIEQLMEEEDMHLISIDGRYVHSLEQENTQMRFTIHENEIEKYNMRAEIDQLRAALINMDKMYQAEAAKVRAFIIGP